MQQWIIFYKLKKSFMSNCAKTLLPKLSKFWEDGTKLLVFVVQPTQSTTGAMIQGAGVLHLLSQRGDFRMVGVACVMLRAVQLICWMPDWFGLFVVGGVSSSVLPVL